jgi:hypothetical protein
MYIYVFMYQIYLYVGRMRDERKHLHMVGIQVKDEVLLLETKRRRNGSSEGGRSKDEVPQKNSFLAFREFLSEIGFVLVDRGAAPRN